MSNLGGLYKFAPVHLQSSPRRCYNKNKKEAAVMRRVFAMLLAVALVVSLLAGCSGVNVKKNKRPSVLESFSTTLTNSGYTFVTTTGTDGTTTVDLLPPGVTTQGTTVTTKPSVSTARPSSIQPSTLGPTLPTTQPSVQPTAGPTGQFTSTVTVPLVTTDPPVLQLAKTSLLMTSIGSVYNLAAGNIDPAKITWHSQNENIATVKNGLVTAKSMGTTRIYAIYGKQQVFCTVTVQLPTTDPTPPAPKLKLRYTSLLLLPGYTQSIYDGTIPAVSIQWQSSNSRVATVTDGVVKAISPGSATIQATWQGQVATCIITVQQPTTDPTTAPKTLKLEPGNLSLTEGQILQFDTEASCDIPVSAITWSSTDAQIASVVAGKVTALKPGTCYINASYQGQKVSVYCVVKEAAEPEAEITLTHRYLTLFVGGSLNIYTGNVPVSEVTWINTDPQVASISNGVVTALKSGQTIIRAIYKDKSAFCTVTVQQMTTDPTTVPSTTVPPTTVGTTTGTTTPATHGKLDYSRRYMYNLLDSQEKGWYRAIDAAVNSLQDNVKLTGDFSDPKWYTIYFVYMFDNPEHFYLGAKVAYSSSGKLIFSYSDGTSNSYHGGADKGDLENLTDTMRQNIRSRKATFDAQVKKIIADIPVDIPDVEKELMIYDRLLVEMYYNTSADWDYVANSNWSAYGGIVEKRGVCEAYAEAFQTLCYAVGINCTGVIGTANGGGHKWNAVFIGGDWYQCDVTFDDPVNGKPGVAQFHDYFNLTSTQLLNKNHSITDSDYPGPDCTATKYSYKNYFG